MEAKLEAERKQLVSHWTKRFQNNPDWIANKLRQVHGVLAASNGDEAAQRSLGSFLRQLHDKLGFKAKGPASDGGLLRRRNLSDTTVYRYSTKMRIETRSDRPH